jgi:hypothetical protein
MADVQVRVRASGWDTCIVVNDAQIVLGRLGRAALAREDDVTAEEVMSSGPTTVPPSVTLQSIVERMRLKNLTSALVTRSSVLPWDERHFMNLSAELCRRAAIGTGDTAELTLELMRDEVPAELAEALRSAPRARVRWDELTPSMKRQFAYDVASAKRAETRERQAKGCVDQLLTAPSPGPNDMDGVDERGRGDPRQRPARRRCGPDREGCTYENIHVGIWHRTGALELVPGDATRARWEIEITVRQADDGALDYIGPYVHGRRVERCLGLIWGTLAPDDSLEMFRGAKLRLADIDPSIVERALRSDGRLVCKLGLTDKHGYPRCASVRPPDITWSATG